MCRLLVVASFFILTLAGCSGGDDEAAPLDTSTLTAAELGWIRAYSGWTIEIYDDEEEWRSGSSAVAACRDRLEEIGTPPTERLQPAADLAPAICPFLAREGMRRRAFDQIEDADALVVRYFRDERPLEMRTGVSEGSRADIGLSAVASELVERAVEVRCWADEEWRQVVTEDDAWADESTDPNELVGWSDDDLDRIHLVLEACNAISRVQQGDVSAWNRDDRIEAADSIETLAHEIQHFLLPDADEAEVECSAIRSLAAFAKRFGVTAPAGAELEELYRTEIYPDLDEEYTAGGCPT